MKVFAGAPIPLSILSARMQLPINIHRKIDQNLNAENDKTFLFIYVGYDNSSCEINSVCLYNQQGGFQIFIGNFIAN